MKFSLVEQLAIHCSLLLVKASNTRKRSWEVTRADPQATTYGQFRLGNIYNLVDTKYKKVANDLNRFLAGSLLKIKDLKQETAFQDSIPNIDDVSSNIKKWLRILLLQLPIRKGENFYSETGIEILGHILYKNPTNFLIYSCNYILNSFRKLGVDDNIMNILNEKLKDLVNALGSACEEISKNFSFEEKDGKLDSLLTPTESGLDAMQVKLDDMFLEQCAPALFTIQGFFELLMEVSSNMNGGDLNDENIAIYSDIIATYKALEKISTLMFNFPKLVKLEQPSKSRGYPNYFYFLIPTLHHSKFLFNDMANKIEKSVSSEGSNRPSADLEKDLNDEWSPRDLIEDMFGRARGLSSIKELNPGILKNIEEIFTKLKENNQVGKGNTCLSYEVYLITNWLLFITYEDNTPEITSGN